MRSTLVCDNAERRMTAMPFRNSPAGFANLRMTAMPNGWERCRGIFVLNLRSASVARWRPENRGKLGYELRP
jgi:hypothetical protein